MFKNLTFEDTNAVRGISTREYNCIHYYRPSAPKSQLSWLNMHHSPIPPPVTAKHRVVKLQEISLRKE